MAKVTTKQIITALKNNAGLVAVSAKKLNITPQAIYKRAKAEPKIQRTLETCRAEVIDLAEGKLFEAVKEAKPWAICFILKCLAKERGYVERQEIAGASGGPIEIKVSYEDSEGN